MDWVVAIDGGGSKIAVAVQPLKPKPILTGAPSGTTTTAPADYRCQQYAGTGSVHPHSWQQAQVNLRRAIEATQATLPMGDRIRTILLALAGAGRSEDQQKVVDWARTLPDLADPSISIRCVGDIDPLVNYESSGARCTIAVILGTGSIVATLNRQGSLVRAGGWGPQLGDECSGASLGLAALRTVCQWLDQGRPSNPSPLIQSILQEVHLGDGENAASQNIPSDRMPQLSAELIRLAADRGSCARFSLALVDHALASGDPQALGLLEPHVLAVAQQVAMVFRRAWQDEPQVHLVFAGGLAARQPKLQIAVMEACVRLGVPVIGYLCVDPVIATLQLALRS